MVAHLAECASCAHAAIALARLDNALRAGAAQASLVSEPPASLRSRLASLAPRVLGEAAAARVDCALRAALVEEPSLDLRQRLTALAVESAAALAAGNPDAAASPQSAAAASIDAALVRALLVTPPADLQDRLAALAPRVLAEAAGERVDAALRSAVVAEVPAELQERLAVLAPKAVAEAAGERVDAALRASLVAEAPLELQERLLAVVAEPARERVDAAVRSSLVVEAPAELQAALAELTPGATAPHVMGWFAGVWQSLRARPGVLAGQLAALAVLAYAVMQLALWVGSLPIVLGDVPYALELLVLSPAVDYLSQVESVVQQLGLWLLVAAAGWLLAQGLPWQRQPEP
jgi:hypothetical protein